jgi:hypothetical protein
MKPVTITLKSGRTIRLMMLHQSLTYAGLMLGYPHRQGNETIIAAALQEAPRIAGQWGQPYLIPPVETPGDTPPERLRVGPHVNIPDVICTARFESFPPAHDPHADYSVLLVVWFQGEFALPIDKPILDALGDIDWNTLATDGWGD